MMELKVVVQVTVRCEKCYSELSYNYGDNGDIMLEPCRICLEEEWLTGFDQANKDREASSETPSVHSRG